MAEVIQFRPAGVAVEHAVDTVEDFEIDLLTAVDAAIRDLRDIAQSRNPDDARARADECREMLERAYRAVAW